jgi:hypothetical protein
MPQPDDLTYQMTKAQSTASGSAASPIGTHLRMSAGSRE